MRIAIYHNLPNGGAKRALLEWVKRLSQDHYLGVYSLDQAEHAYCDLRPYVAQYEILAFAPRRSFRSPFGRLNQFQRWRDLVALERLGRVVAGRIDRTGYDVVFANPCQYTLIPTLLKFVITPAVYYLHEPFGPSFGRAFRRPYLKEEPWRQAIRQIDPLPRLYTDKRYALQKESVLRTQLLLANSRFTQAEMRKAYGVTAPVCRYGVNLADFRPMPDIPKGNHVLSVGALEPRKGFDFLIESLAHIPLPERPPLHLACNWVDPNEESYVRQLALHKGVELHIMCNLATAELAVEYNRASLCVYAPVREPLGLVPLEAMACGTPVVGVAEGGVSETVLDGETGTLVERDPVAFAAAVRSLLRDPGTVARYGARAKEYVAQEWSWDNSTAMLESYLLKAAGGEPVRRSAAVQAARQDARRPHILSGR